MTRPIRRWGPTLAIGLAAVAACGKRGDPLPPLRPVPGVVTDLSLVRSSGGVEVAFTIPATNVDGTTPPAVDRVDVYARTMPAGRPAPSAAQLIGTPSDLVGSVAVTRASTSEAGENAEAVTPESRGVRPGDHVSVVDRSDLAPAVDGVDETDADESPAGGAAPAPGPAGEPASGRAEPPAAGAAVPAAAGTAPAPVDDTPVRYYVVVAVAGPGRGRTGRPSPVLRLPVDTLPATPEAVSATYDEHTLHLTWRPAADGQQFRVVRVDRSTTPATVTAVTPEPTPTAAVEMPVEFGREFCLAVLPLRVAGAVIEQGDPSAATCLTPADTFPPPAPTGLQAVQDGGSVTLIWTPVDATDLAGYVVLRGDGAGAELTPLFREPLAAATYRDGAVTPGRTYTYAVYAVDGAASPNVSQLSERQTVTVR